jgi:Lrp/AsnC family leucine-responsive transcriptional regulator
MKLDHKDKQILNQLVANSRSSIREIGKVVGMSSPAVSERIKQMESFGVINGYSVKIDFEKAGYPISCIIEATVKNGQYELFKQRIEKLTNIEFCYRIAGQACYMLKIHVEAISEIETFINQLSDIAHTVSHVVFSNVETDVTI